MLVERLERRDLLTVYNPIGVTLSPSPVEGTAFAGEVVGTFVSPDAIGGLTATIDWGSTATPTTSVGTINLIGSQFVPGVGDEPMYSVSGGTTYPEETNGSTLPITVTLSDSTDSTTSVITSSTTVADAPLTTTGGISSASVTEGTKINFTGAIALMTFTDGNPNSTAAEFRAAIDWGDGTPVSYGTITKAGATYTVSALHAYVKQTGVPNTLKVTVTDNGGQSATHNSSITVTDAALSGASGQPVSAAGGQQLVNVPLGQFLDGNPYATAADFKVTINWGDGTTNDPGTATLVGGTLSNAQILVGGSHLYANAAGSPYAVTVTVDDVGGATTTIHTTATVTQTPLAVSSGSTRAVSGVATQSQYLGSFFDAGVPKPASSYSATIRWGDGTADDTTGGVSIIPVAGQPGQFSVAVPAHTYATPGLYPISITVSDGDPNSGIGNGSAIVAAPGFSVLSSSTGPITGVVEGQPIAPTTQVARIDSLNPQASLSDFTAVIDWGDGTPSTIGTLTQPGGVGTTFLVAGGHTYAHAAPNGHTVTVRVTDNSNNSATATTAVPTVGDAPLTSVTPLQVAATANVPLGWVPVATFVDTNPGATAADFTVAIDWNDTTPADFNTQVVLTGGGPSGAIFAIYGSHTYAAPGSYSIITNIIDKDGQSLRTVPNTANATVISSTLGVAVLPQSAAAGVAIPPGTTIATFTASPVADLPGKYHALINWGDGSSSDSAVTINSQGGSSFVVRTNAGHTYAATGSYVLTLTVSDGFAGGVGGNLAVVSGSLSSPPVITSGSPIVAVEGSFSTGLVIATFTVGNPNASAGSFSAVVDWGDGSPASVGLVTNGPTLGTFLIRGNHTYADEGSYLVSVSLADSAGSHVATSTTASVSDAPLTGATGLALTASQDAPLVNIPLGSFVDANRGATEADDSAAINWGDGSAPSVGSVTRVGGSASGNVFSVSGSHTYVGSGPFTVTVAIVDAGGTDTTFNAQVVVRAPQVVSVVAFPIAAAEGSPTVANSVVGSFGYGLNIAPAGTFGTSIDWGDGTPGVAGTVVANGSGYSVIAPAHTYAQPGRYIVRVGVGVVGNPLSAMSFAASVASVTDAALSAVATPPVSGTERVALSNVVVGSFSDADPGASAGQFFATISWGDGSSSQGTIGQPGGPGTAFVVTGSHTYADSMANGTGSFSIGVVVHANDGQSLVLGNNATVADVAIGVSVMLNPADDHGVSNADGITNDNTPTFLGGTEPGATVQLYAISASGTSLVGQVVAGPDGRFAVPVTTPLPDGVYTISVVATDASGHSVASANDPQPIVIDTVGPRVTGVQFDRSKGRVFVTVADDRSGLDQHALIDGANYQFGTYVPGHPTNQYPFFVSSLAATPAASPTDPQVLTLTINRGKTLPTGRYLLTLDSAGGAANGLEDAAGNALDGEFYGYFGSGNGKPGGNFVAGLDVSRHTVFAPVPSQNGYATPNNPPGTPAVGHSVPVSVPKKHTTKPAHGHATKVVVKAAKPHGVHSAAKPAVKKPH